MLIAILAARVLGPGTFGLFGVVFLVFVTTQGIARALVAEPLLVRPRESEERPGEAIGSALLLGLGMAAVVAVAGAVVTVWSSTLGVALLALALCIAPLVVQDLGRYLAFATRRPARAVVLDVVWLGSLVVAVGALAVSDTATLTWFILAWAGSGAVTALLVVRQHPGHRIAVNRRWLQETWPFSWRYASSFAGRQGSVLLSSSIVAALIGAQALGGLNGALLLFGPLVQLQAAAVAAGVAEVAHLEAPARELVAHVWRYSAMTVVMAGLNVALVLVLPDSLGRVVLGDTWEHTQPLLLAAGIQMLFISTVSGPRAGLLGSRKVELTLRVDMATAVLTAAAVVVSALVWDDVETVVWALAAITGVAALLWWLAFVRYVRAPQPPEGAPQGAA